MPNIRRVEYEVGNDAYARAVFLILERTSAGKMAWTIHVEAANQRDDTQSIRGIPDATILAMAEVVKEKQAATKAVRG